MTDDRLCALADSLPAAIRWRFSDYGQLLAKELKILAAPAKLAWPPPEPVLARAPARARRRTRSGNA